LKKNLKASPGLDVSSFVFTEDELKHSHPLLLDVRGRIVLYDRGFLKEIPKSIDEFCEGGVAKELKVSRYPKENLKLFLDSIKESTDEIVEIPRCLRKERELSPLRRARLDSPRRVCSR